MYLVGIADDFEGLAMVEQSEESAKLEEPPNGCSLLHSECSNQ